MTLKVLEREIDPDAVSQWRSAGASASGSTEIVWQLSGRADPDAPVSKVSVSRRPFTVGRHHDNTLCLDNSTVSGRHAELVVESTGLFVVDQRSRNGTFVNGVRVAGRHAVADGDLLQFGTAMYTVKRLAGAVGKRTIATDVGEQALANLQFQKLILEPAIIPHFQPIVRLGDERLVGFEVLIRSRLPGLETPVQMFKVAAEWSMETELSSVARREGVRVAQSRRLECDIYLNTHPAELQYPQFLQTLRELRAEFPETAIVIEIHEAAVTSSQSLREMRACLDELDMRLAFDDFGAGQSRLMELAEIAPHVLKFDMRLVRGLPDAPPERRHMVKSLVQIVRDLGVTPLAEGIETTDEAAVCLDAGFELAQGYLFGRPAIL